MSALARYHFVWNAYENVRKYSCAGKLMTTKKTAGREELATRVPQAQLNLVDRTYGFCLSLAQGSPRIQIWLKTKQVEAVGVGKAGQLATDFRNYLFHGDEIPPEPDDWDDKFPRALDGKEAISPHSYRLVSFTRLTLHLLQTLMHAEIKRSHDIETTHVPFLSRGVDAEFNLPCAFVLNLASFWPEKRWTALSTKELEEVAVGCDVSAESLGALVMEMAEEAG